MNKGMLIVFSGPSGVGKGTILKEVMKDETLNLTYSISMTTREIREGEQDGVNYFFVSKEEFEKAIEEDRLLEYAKYVDNYYGTPKDYVFKQMEEGKNVILEIEVQGAAQVMERYPECTSIFILPPNLEELERRIRNRHTESDEVIKKRVEQAASEIYLAANYEYKVVNDTVESAVREVKYIISREILERN